jgi:hypothetical protein
MTLTVVMVVFMIVLPFVVVSELPPPNEVDCGEF